MILELHRQISVSAIARQLGIDRKTARTHIAKGPTAPTYTPRPAREHLIDPFTPYLRERLAAFPGLTGRRLWRELKERGYRGGYTAVTDVLRDLRPAKPTGFEIRFETLPGEQRKSTLRSSPSSSPTNRACGGSSGCSQWCSATPG
jgi:transposase